MITLFVSIIVVAILLWLWLSDMGVQPSDGVFLAIILVSVAIVSGVILAVMGFFDRHR